MFHWRPIWVIFTFEKNTHIQKDLDPSNQTVPNMEAVVAHIPIKIIYLDLPKGAKWFRFRVSIHHPLGP